MRLIALDTCLGACSVAVLDGARVLAWRSEAMARGHQERLAPMAHEVMAEAGLRFSDLERVAVTVGPGSFTGLRVGIAFAKGLSGALDVPLVGIGGLEAMAAAATGRVAAVIDAHRDQVYLQIFDDGAPLGPPAALGLAEARRHVSEAMAEGPGTLIGSGAALLQAAAPGAELREVGACDPRRLGRLALTLEPAPIQPLYLRAPDARAPA